MSTNVVGFQWSLKITNIARLKIGNHGTAEFLNSTDRVMCLSTQIVNEIKKAVKIPGLIYALKSGNVHSLF
jgi:hypothetical protein